ncbi:hypothetical protein Prudu_011590 [Prunus dulcis]|uniref:Pentatricopeptide repeat superfamily protein n=1 Tax=Prunus dulcis TaxID=3755 RepID=A0A4Y1RAX2_PRUDU|nr:hypothetical protein Prudu_011590 [Prunus dulcis]
MQLLCSSIQGGLKKLSLCPISPCELLTCSLHSHFSVLAIPSNQALQTEPVNNDETEPQFLMKSSRKVPNWVLTSRVIQLSIHSLRITQIWVLDRMKRERRVFIEQSFILMFRAYGKAHLPNKAVELFYRMVDEFQCRRTVKSFNSVLNVIIQEGHYSHALEFYSHVVGTTGMNISPNVLSFNLIIKSMCKLGLVDRAVQVFREMPLRNCTPDVFTYSTLMDGLCKEKRIDEAVFLLDEMQLEGCIPSPVTFNVLINALCKKGDLGRAAKLVDNMLLKGCVPNEVTYNTLIHGLCLKGKLDKAVSLLDRMVSNKCVPNDVTYGTIINGLVKRGRAVDGARVLMSMEERGNHANEYIYSVLVSGLFKEGKSEDAMRLWKEMLEKGCKPNTIAYSTLINGLCGEGKPDEAKEVFSEMVSNGCMPNSFTYSSLMRGFFQTGQSQKAILLWKEMANNMRNEVCYSVLIHGLCEDGQLNEALIAWQQMLGRGYKPDVVAYSSMIHGLCNAGLVEQGLKLFNEMLCQEPECQPDVITYNILFNMLDRGCDPDSVTCDIFLRSLREKLDPPQDGREFLNELVVRLFKQQRIVGASIIVEVMLQKFLPPKASTWTRVVQELCKPKKRCADICFMKMCKPSTDSLPFIRSICQTADEQRLTWDKQPIRKMFVAIDKDGNQGTSGTPKTFGDLCWGKNTAIAKVPKNQRGTVTT